MPGAICAAKKIHEVFLDRSKIPAGVIRRAVAQFVRECQLMSTLDHPNIVKFLGVAVFPGSRLPAMATADEPSRLVGPRNRDPTPSRCPQGPFTIESKVFDSAQRCERPCVPPRAITAHHPPRFVCEKHSSYLGDGGQDCRLGRSSYRASYEDCSDNDKRAWGLSLHASRVSRFRRNEHRKVEI